MKHVKSIFFLTEEETKQIKKDTGDRYIDFQGPHFELEDGTIVYCKVGYPAGQERWFAPIKK